jgi:hypothetical protein
MNKTLRFGCQPFGKNMLIKLNVKISDEAAGALMQRFADAWIADNGKFGFRIEACLKHDQVNSFLDEIKLACLDYKIDKLQAQAVDILNKYAVPTQPMDGDDLSI